jgi:hypothetical protein
VGCGQRVVVGGGPKVEDWGIATGTANGRPLLMFLSGAVAEHKTAKDSFKTPLKNPVQSKFAGGVMDGYVVLLDLSPGPQPPRKRETHDGPKPVKRAEPPLLPAEGQKWTLGGESYFNVQLTLRETPDGELWPRFYHGRADEGGRFIYTTDPAGDTNAGFALRTHHLEQGDGDQSRRLFGTRLGYYHKEKGKDARGRTIREYVLDPQIDFTITGMTPWEVREVRRESSKRITIKQQPTCTVKGVLHFGDRDIPVDDATCTAYFSIPRKVDDTVPGIKPNKAGLNIVFTVTGSELGFAGELARKRIRVRWACTAYSAVNYKGAGLEEVDLPEIGEPKDDEVDLDLGIDLDL